LAFNRERQRNPGRRVRWEKITKTLHRQGMLKKMSVLTRRFKYMKWSFVTALKNNTVDKDATDPYTKLYNDTFFSIVNRKIERDALNKGIE
jgi:hypothetical protein